MERRFKHIAIVAVSGTGKGTVIDSILKDRSEFCFSISATTRERRAGEVHEVHYHFLQLDEFEKKILNDEFLEYFSVYKNTYYGTLKSEIDKIERLEKSAIFDIDINGAIELKDKLQDEIAVFFLYAPIEVIDSRLRKRKTESEEKILERIATGTKEISRINELIEKTQCRIIHYGDGKVTEFVANEIINFSLRKSPISR